MAVGNTLFQKNEISGRIMLEASVMPRFCVILIRKSICYIIFMIQNHLQCQKVSLKVE